MIKVNNVVKTFDGFRALDGLTMEVEKGSIYGLVGPNGAGKTSHPAAHHRHLPPRLGHHHGGRGARCTKIRR